jgi:hypothetical protein
MKGSEITRDSVIAEMDTSDGAPATDSDRSDIAALAYQLWHDRGCPMGSPDEDWFRAEDELKSRNMRGAAASQA